MFDNYYKILGLSQNASQIEIRRAYRNFAKKYHPDLGGNEADFILIKKAYETLSDNHKREKYDLLYNKYQTNENKEPKTDYTNKEQNNTNDQKKEKSKGYTNQKANSKRKKNCDRRNKQTDWQNLYEKKKKMVSVWQGISFIIVVSTFILLVFIANFRVGPGNVENNEETVAKSQYDYMAWRNSELQRKLAESERTIEELTAYQLELEADLLSFSKEELDSHGSSSDREDSQIIYIYNENHFQLGDTQDHVQKVMGTPTSIMGDMWWYNYSTVTFSDGRVSGWDDLSGVLKIDLGN